MNDKSRGKLTITAPVTFGGCSLMPLITGFLCDNPDVHIDLHLTDLFVDLVEEGYEAAFRIGPLATTGLTARPLAPYRLVVCAAPAYLAAGRTPLIPADLEHHECLGYAFWSRPADREWVFYAGAVPHNVRVSSRLQINESRPMHVVYTANRQRTAKLRRFVEVVLQRFGPA